MCHSRRHRKRSSEEEADKEEVEKKLEIIEDTPSRDRPGGDIIKVPVKALKRAKAMLLA